MLKKYSEIQKTLFFVLADLMKSAYERVDEREGWMTEYNVKHKFSSPWRVREAMQSIGIGDYLLSTLETFQVLRYIF